MAAQDGTQTKAFYYNVMSHHVIEDKVCAIAHGMNAQGSQEDTRSAELHRDAGSELKEPNRV